VRYPLPYAFARSQQLLLEETDEGAFTLWMPQVPPRSAIGEVARKYPVKAFEALAPNELAQRISAAYAQGESNAAAVVSEVQGDDDLSRMMQ
jgi:general secretion pathway protein E